MKWFSIVVVALNAGERLTDTLQSILEQSCQDYEIIVKDGGSQDGSVEHAEKLLVSNSCTESRGDVQIYQEADNGIYDAMNQALKHAKGKYVLFLNCGDCFYHKDVLKRVRECMQMQQTGQETCTDRLCIYYGNVFEKQTGEVVASNPRLDAFACYRNIPCHQVCFYDRRLFEERAYDTDYRVRADYEHFLWCFFCKKAAMVYMPVEIASYEGGGFSETAKNRRISAAEHKKITKTYMTGTQRLGYRLILLVTLAPLRRKMAESKKLAGVYQKVKSILYRGGNRAG